MYITYNKLWKLLIDRGLTKTELCNLTGMSSRTMAKLTKDQSVTTDTLLSICTVLSCDVSDIMEIYDENTSQSIYEAFRHTAKLLEEDEVFKTYEFSYRGRCVLLKKTVKKANKHTVIHCEPNALNWEQIYPLGRSPVSEVSNLTNGSFWTADALCVIVISGKPMCFEKLDEYKFISVHRDSLGKGEIYTMSETAFKIWNIQ